jgi:hypothetical protein
MNIAIDLMAIIGGILISVGVFLQFGLAFALIAGGALLIILAMRAANVNGDVNGPSNSQ